MAINVYFARHGQTYLNLYNRMQNWADDPLTPKGEGDAKRVGRTLTPIRSDCVFCSDLTRAVSTTRFLLTEYPGNNPTPIPEPAFREEFFGYFEGGDGQHFTDLLDGLDGYHNFTEMIAGWGPDELKNKIATTDDYGTAEDHIAFWERVDKGFDRLRALPGGSEVLVVSHGTTIRSIIQRYSDACNPGDSPCNESIAKLTLDKSNTIVDFYNKLELSG